MERISVSEFSSRFKAGYDFVYNIENQPDKNKGRQAYIVDDRRVFSRILVAQDLGCIRFSNGDDNIMQVESVSHVVLRNHGDMGLYFADVVCKADGVEPHTFGFLVRSK